MIQQSAATKQGGFYEFKPMYVGKLPIPDVATKERRALGKLVERILEAKRSDRPEDISALEAEIDDRVFRLYDLTRDESRLVNEASH